MKKRSPILDQAFSEVFKNKPKIVAKTQAKKGKVAARKQSIAIAFSKAKANGY